VSRGQAGGVVYRERDGRTEILLITTRGERPSWIFPKGHVEAGEDDVQAALREVLEESGVTGVAVTTLGGEEGAVRYVVVRALEDGDPEPGRAKRWVSPDEALVLLTHEDSRRLLLAALAAIDPARGTDRLADLVLAEHHLVGRARIARERGAEGKAALLVVVAAGAWFVSPERPLALAAALALGAILGWQVAQDVRRVEDAARSLARLRGLLVPADDPRRALFPEEAADGAGPLRTVIGVVAALSAAQAATLAPGVVPVVVGVAVALVLVGVARRR
jgi:8-oxo-dGTP pyrophosphatase MutT (NUDIX family)